MLYLFLFFSFCNAVLCVCNLLSLVTLFSCNKKKLLKKKKKKKKKEEINSNTPVTLQTSRIPFKKDSVRRIYAHEVKNKYWVLGLCTMYSFKGLFLDIFFFWGGGGCYWRELLSEECSNEPY